MNLNKQIDWLQISKFNTHDAQSILRLNQIIKGKSISYDMYQKIPKGYLIKLLKLCQTQIRTFEQNKQKISDILILKQNEKLDLIKRSKQLQSQLLISKQGIGKIENQIKLKQEIIKKISEKIKNREKQKQKNKKKIQQVHNKQAIKVLQKYYCPYCKNDQFLNKQIFEYHMIKEHGSNVSEQKQMKKFILELKQKQITLMEMLMKQNSQLSLGTRLLFQKQLNLRTQSFQQSYTLSKTQNQNEVQKQLFCSSQYIWLKNQNQQKHYQKVPKSQKINQKQVPKAINNSKKQKLIQQNIDYNYKDAQKYNTINFDHSKNINKNSQIEISLYKTHNQKQIIPQKQKITKLSIKPYKYLQESDSSIYHEAQTLNKSIRQSQGYIYFAGPLLSDDSESEVDDYFNIQKETVKAADQEIRINENLLNKLDASSKKIDNDKQKNDYEKSTSKVSDKILINDLMLSYQDSIEDKDFSLSKDSQTINLSDLKYSKLQKKMMQNNEVKTNLLEQNYKSCESLNNQNDVGIINNISNDYFLKDFYRKQKNIIQSEQKKQIKIMKTQLSKKQNLFQKINQKQSKYQNDILNQFYRQPDNNINLKKKMSKTQTTFQKKNNFQLNKQEFYFQSNLSNIKPSSKKNQILVQKIIKKSNKTQKLIQIDKISKQSQKINTSRLILKQLQDLAQIKQQDAQQSLYPLDSHISYISVETINENRN